MKRKEPETTETEVAVAETWEPPTVAPEDFQFIMTDSAREEMERRFGHKPKELVIPYQEGPPSDSPPTMTEALDLWADNVLNDMHTDDNFVSFCEQIIAREIGGPLSDGLDEDIDYQQAYYSIMNEVTTNVLARAIVRNRHFHPGDEG